MQKMAKTPLRGFDFRTLINLAAALWKEETDSFDALSLLSNARYIGVKRNQLDPLRSSKSHLLDLGMCGFVGE